MDRLFVCPTVFVGDTYFQSICLFFFFFVVENHTVNYTTKYPFISKPPLKVGDITLLAVMRGVPSWAYNYSFFFFLFFFHFSSSLYYYCYFGQGLVVYFLFCEWDLLFLLKKENSQWKFCVLCEFRSSLILFVLFLTGNCCAHSQFTL